MTRCAFVIPGDIDLPTGGYAYDREVLGRLGAEGVATEHVRLPGSFPFPTPADLETTVAALQAVPGDTLLLFDGLAYGAMPLARLQELPHRIVALCHRPLALEAGLDAVRQAALRQSETAALARASHVIVSSRTTAGILAAEFGVPADAITVAEPGVKPAERAVGSLAGLALQMLAVGSVVPRKGYDVLIEALAPLTSRNWRLSIVGALDLSPPTARAIAEMIEHNGLADRCRMTGPVRASALAAHYHGADLFVMSSHFEGYGMVLAEAMAHGLPIVCTTGGAAAETVPEGAALKVPPGDAVALREAIVDMLDDRGLRRRMADASWAAGQRLPRWSDTARHVANALRRAAA